MNTQPHVSIDSAYTEHWVMLTRIVEAKVERLFIARCKYRTGKTQANRWKRAVEKNFDLATVTQKDLDAFRDKVNEIKHEEFVAARGFSDEAITPAEYREIEKAAWKRVGITVR
jgi:lysophospholipase L1-like esterase